MKIAVIIPNFNSAKLVIRCVSSMLEQTLPSDCSMEIVVVDDGSTDGSAEELARTFGAGIQLERLLKNVGRSSARNAGAAATNADLLIFVDSDCVAVGDGFVSAHVVATNEGSEVTFGEVCTPGSGFWDRLQRSASSWRLRRFEAGDAWVFTTQNVSTLNTRFREIGGFDPEFDRYGFEDRDLFIRLAAVGAVVRYAPDARVLHQDLITLKSVARKLGEAGYHSAHVFDAKYPDVYRRMPFFRLDARHHQWLTVVDAVIWPLAGRLITREANWLEWRWVPFRVRALMARGLYGLSYLHGTVLRRNESRSS